MAKKLIRFIVNPISGISSKDSVIEILNGVMNRDLYEWEVCPTQYAGHGAVLATMAAENHYDVVVAVGGDGTVNEVARSLVNTDTVLGIIPCGSGNGLARHLQIPLDVREAVEMINGGNVIAIDYGLVNHKPFFCTCGMGFDAEVSYKFASASKRGLFTYIEKTFQELAKYKPEVYTLEDQFGKRTYEAFCIVFANASQYGNNIYVAPKASMTDGLMDISLLESFKPFEAPALAVQLFSGRLKDGVNHVKMSRTRKIKVIREAPGVIHCDGDPMQVGREVNVEIIKHGLKVITNSDAKTHPQPLIQTIGEQVNMALLPPAEAFVNARDSILEWFKLNG